MHKRIFLAGLSLAALASPIRAQDVAPTPTPTPGVIPGVVPERFTLGPPVAATPVPLPSPTPSAAPPRVAPTPVSERVAPRSTPTPAASPVATPMPASAPVSPAPTPVATAAPVPLATASATPAAAQVPASSPTREGLPIWLWALAGLGLAALAFAAYRLLRVKPAEAAQPIAEPVAAAPPPPPPRPRPAPVPAAAPVAPVADPFELVLQPQRITLAEREVVLELELMIGNRQPHSAEGIRVQAVPISANPDQDRQLAAFHAGPFVDSGAPPFDLPAGGGGRMPVRIALPRDRLHVVQLGNRPMFVPMVLVDVRWRSGISLKRLGADFMLGTQGQGGKLGPIWLDRQPSGPFAATRYVARITAAA